MGEREAGALYRARLSAVSEPASRQGIRTIATMRINNLFIIEPSTRAFESRVSVEHFDPMEDGTEG